jgi:hypothetical protein
MCLGPEDADDGPAYRLRLERDVVTIVDATDRQLMIERLAQQNDESAAEIARREAAREADPNSELERLMADQRFTKDESDFVYTEPVGSPAVSESDDVGIIYRRYDNGALPPAPAPEPHPFGVDPELGDAIDKFAEADRRLLDLEKENAELRAENVEVKGLLRDALERFSKLEGKCDAVLALMKPKVWKP